MAIDGSILFDSGWIGVAATGLQGPAMNGRVTLNPPVVSGSLEGPLQLGLLGAAGVMLSGSLSAGRGTLAPVAATGAMLAGNTAVGAVHFQSPTVSGNQGIVGAAAFQPLDVGGTLVRGAAGSGSLRLRSPIAAGAAVSQGLGAGSLSLLAPSLSAASTLSNVARAACALLPPTLVGTAVSGGIASGSILLPLVTLKGSGVASVAGMATITLPMLQVAGQMLGTPAAITFTGIALNTRTKAVSNYQGLAPNSMARFNGVTLLATPQGIVALVGDTDQGAPIDAHLTVGKTNFNDPQVKRVLTGYIGMQADGDLEITLTADDHHEYTYQLIPRVIDEQHQTRVKFGMGVKGVYWQCKLANVGGSDFAIDRVELRPAETGFGVT